MSLQKSVASLAFVILIVAASSLAIAATVPNARALILYNDGNPTPDEQLVLEYINRARANPIVEGQRLGIDITEGLEDDPANGCYGPEYVGPRPPLAMNPMLLATAQGHSEDMYNQNYFSHTDPNGTTAFQRIANAGYDDISAGENMAAGTGMSATDLEDFMMIDSGTPCRPHRINLLDIFPGEPPPAYHEVGVGYYQGSTPNGYGNSFITEDFGTSTSGAPFLTGVVFTDADGSGFYQIGEGISGVTITPSSGNYYAVSSSSGGYAFPIPTSGTITVTASGNGFGPVSQTITLTGENIELDFTPQGATSIQTTTQTSSATTTQTTIQSTSQTTYQPSSSTTTTVQTQAQTSTQPITQSSSTATPQQPLLQSVTFQSTPTVFDGENTPGTITACGNTYSNTQSSPSCPLNFNATANLPSPSTGWQFDHWTWAGGVVCGSDTANPAACSAYNSGGVLIAVYAAQVNVTINPTIPATINIGTCSGSAFGNGASFYTATFGTTTLEGCNIPSGYAFSNWSCTGGLTCQASANPTALTINGPGSIKLDLQLGQVNDTSTSSATSSQANVATEAYTSVSIVTSTVTMTSPVASTSQAASTASTEMTLTPVPGFPIESLAAGILLGMSILALLRRRRR